MRDTGRKTSAWAARYALLVALAMVLSWLESMIPLPVTIPGVKLERSIRDQGFRVRQATQQDLMRLLAVYYQQDVTTDVFDMTDGERVVSADA